MGMMSNGNGNGNEETTLLVRAQSKSCAKLMHVMLFHLLFKITHTHTHILWITQRSDGRSTLCSISFSSLYFLTLTHISTPRCLTKDHTKQTKPTKNEPTTIDLTPTGITNLSVIKARNRIIVIVVAMTGLIIVTVIVPNIATATDPNIVTVVTKEDMGRCTQQATVVAPMEEDTEVVVTEEGNMEEDIKMEDQRG